MINSNDLVLHNLIRIPGGGVNYDVEEFTSSGTWTKPANLNHVIIVVIAGGGGGTAGRRGAASTNRQGGGALSSGVVIAKFLASDLNSTETVVVGTGGSASAATTADNTSGAAGGNGGNSYVRNTNFLRVFGSTGNSGGGVGVYNSTNASASISDTLSAGVIIVAPLGLTCLGITAPGTTNRGFHQGGYYNWRNCSSAGGNINNSNVKTNSGTLPGWYNTANSLTGEETGVGEGVNGGTPASGYTIGTYLNKYFNWFDPADLTSELPRGGMGGGPGDTAGTIAGGSGGPGRGYGAAGGGGGASTNGANGGAGAAGNPGIVIFVNVYN